MGRPMKRCVALLAAAALLAVALAQEGEQPPVEDAEPDMPEDVPSAAEDGDVNGTLPTSQMSCPADCSGHGKCADDDDGNKKCTCNAGYGGEDCATMDDEFDVYWNRLMASSQSQVFKGKNKLRQHKLDAWNTRIGAMQTRLDAHESDVRRYVDGWYKRSMLFLDVKDHKLQAMRDAVAKLQSELGCTEAKGCVGDNLRHTMGEEIKAHVQTLRDDLKQREENLQTRRTAVDEARNKLVDTVQKGNTVGERSRFHRIVQQWELCDINPNHPSCKEPVPKKAPNQVHIVVETKNYDKTYPASLSKDETAAAKSAHGGVNSGLKSKQK